MQRTLVLLFLPLVLSHAHAQKNFFGLDTTTLAANRIVVHLNNRGFLDNYTTGEAAYWWGYRGNSRPGSLVFDAGVGVSGILNGQIRHAMVHWGSTYAPGPMINGKPALYENPQDVNRYRAYNIRIQDSSSYNPDVWEWPSDLGAPVDYQGWPVITGDQMVWTVYNGADTNARPSSIVDAPVFPRLALEVRQSTFECGGSLQDTTVLANTAFFEYLLINRESSPIDSAYLTFWTDIDFAYVGSNVPGVDTSLQLGYLWETPQQGSYELPAVGFQLLYGPMVPSPGDAALYMGQVRPGYRNLPMTAYWGMSRESTNDSNVAVVSYKTTTIWNIARGRDGVGRTIINPVTGQPTSFTFSGDPVTNTGWVYNLPYNCGESGFQFSSGPFRMAPGDSQWVMIALVPGLGSDALKSITAMRRNAEQLRAMKYDQIAHKQSIQRVPRPTFVPGGPVLATNFPNPFNAGTTIEYLVDKDGVVTLEVFSILGQRVATLEHGVRAIGIYTTNFGPVKLASGVYIARLTTEGGVATKKMLLMK